MKVCKPMLYISFFDNGKNVKIGPFYTASPDGKNAYQVQRRPGVFERITIPTQYHTLEAMTFEM